MNTSSVAISVESCCSRIGGPEESLGNNQDNAGYVRHHVDITWEKAPVKALVHCVEHKAKTTHIQKK